MSSSCAAIRRTYSRPPPLTVRHSGRSKTCSRPWLRQKRTKVASGVSSICPVGHDQIAAAIGSRYHSEKAAE
ncbi:MAG: hypothetical protein AW12_03029 [Candidatus Accumulibacter sp. BA-94]|nr:MAG: hypothetical protein AW12_03029 [Candidatus Accumulibacter sp. BA-94]